MQMSIFGPQSSWDRVDNLKIAWRSLWFRICFYLWAGIQDEHIFVSDQNMQLQAGSG